MNDKRNGKDRQPPGWFTMVTEEEFMGDTVASLSDRCFRLMVALEIYSRNKPYCWASNARMAKAIRRDPRNVRSILAELERDGWIAREQDPGPDNRVGIILRKRIDPAMPVADSATEIALARAGLRRIRIALSEARPPDEIVLPPPDEIVPQNKKKLE
jgi:predicted transcriptional regulator